MVMLLPLLAVAAETDAVPTREEFAALKSEAGEDIVLAPLAQALETAGFVLLRAAVEARNRKDFEAAYRSALKACHGCHVAVEKPQLRPEIPHSPGALLIDMKPDAR